MTHGGVKSSYFYLRDGNEYVTKTVRITDTITIDVDHEGNIIGIEVLNGLLGKDHLFAVLSNIKVAV